MISHKVVGVIFAAAAAFVASSSGAWADEVFSLDCIITTTRGTTACTPTTPVGTITLSDSTVDPNRIDITVTLDTTVLPASVTGLANLFLNFDGTVASGESFHVVETTDPAGTTGNDAGSATYNSNSQGPSNTDLDITINPSGTPGYTYTASLMLRLTDQPKTELDLDASMFDLTDPELDLYGAITTTGTKSPNYGADLETAVPEPPTLAILGGILLGFGGWMGLRQSRRSVNRKQSNAV